MAYGGQEQSGVSLKDVRANQGPFENEVIFEDGSLVEAEDGCEKNPGHKEFHPVSEFSTKHLPAQYNDEDIVKTVKAIADVTCRIYVKYVSTDRPDTFPDSGGKYPFSDYRGGKWGRYGTGWIVRVKGRYTEADGKLCPCPSCKSLPEADRSKTFGKIMIWTAKHLIFDGQEARESEVELFRDEDAKRGAAASDLYRLYPYRMWYSDIEGDWCGVMCVTHNLPLWDRLGQMYRLCERLQRDTDKKYKASEERLAILVSHPHGFTKRVSVGTWSHRQELEHANDKVQTIYVYNCPTCRGSSGAPVWVLGRKRRGLFTSHPHSRVDDAKLKQNRSAVGFDW